MLMNAIRLYCIDNGDGMLLSVAQWTNSTGLMLSNSWSFNATYLHNGHPNFCDMGSQEQHLQSVCYMSLLNGACIWAFTHRQ